MDPNEATKTSVAVEVGEMELTDNQEGESRGSAYEVVTMPSRFAQPQGKGFIDVYWLYDDGGGCRDSQLHSGYQSEVFAVCFPAALTLCGVH